MSKLRRYPRLFIRSKNDLAKHISHSGFSKEEALRLINDVILNFDHYWKDSEKSEPKKEKYIRNASHTALGRLLGKIDSMVLAPHDSLIPEYIFGGLKKRNHTKAAKHLIGVKRKRILLKIDLERFFEQIRKDQVFRFFRDKCECHPRAAKILSDFCCVPFGPKNSGSSRLTIARGFSTSPRLAVWCNLDVFIKLDRLVRKKLKGKDPRLSIYVDDIGITASRVTKKEMGELRDEITKFLTKVGLVTNQKKTAIISHEEGIEYVGIRINRNTLSTGAKAKSKRDKVANKLRKTLSTENRTSLKRKQKGMRAYKKYVENQ